MKEMITSTMWAEETLTALQASNDMVMRDWRAEQLKQFLLQGFPNRHVENWKYTNVNEIVDRSFSITTSLPRNIDLPESPLTNAYQMIFINGHWMKELSTLPEEIECLDLPTALTQTIWRGKIAIDVNYQTPFTLLNDALFTSGFLLRVPRDVHLDRPICIIHFTPQTSKNTMSHVRNLFIIGENASVTVFEDYRGEQGAAYFNNVVTQIETNANARASFYKLQRESNDAFHIANTVVHQHRDSEVKTYSVSAGAKLSRDDLNYSLDGSGARCQLVGYYHAKGDHLVDHHVRVDHRVPHCTSEQNYKGIADGKSSAIFNGKIIVASQAQKTVATQSNKNLLLSESAEINTKPELEIYADDVKCSHGATVGQLDESALFYLRSRGLKEEISRHLLTCAFAGDIMDKLAHEAIADVIKAHVTQQLAVEQCAGDCHHG